MKKIISEEGCRTCKHIACDGKYPCNVCGDNAYWKYEPIEELKSSDSYEHKLRLSILEKHLGKDFYKTGHLHNKISDAMHEESKRKIEEFIENIKKEIQIWIHNTDDTVEINEWLNSLKNEKNEKNI